MITQEIFYQVEAVSDLECEYDHVHATDGGMFMVAHFDEDQEGYYFIVCSNGLSEWKQVEHPRYSIRVRPVGSLERLRGLNR